MGLPFAAVAPPLSDKAALGVRRDGAGRAAHRSAAVAAEGPDCPRLFSSTDARAIRRRMAESFRIGAHANRIWRLRRDPVDCDLHGSFDVFLPAPPGTRRPAICLLAALQIVRPHATAFAAVP